MIRIRRFGIARTATVLAVLYALAALIFFAIFAVFVLIAGSSMSDIPGAENIPGFAPAAGAVGVLIFGAIAAVFYGLFGWIFTAIFCLLYNWVAGFTGGVEFELKAAPAVTAQAAPPAEPPATTPPTAAT